MHWNKDENETFPAPHPREPVGLRQDILDEIADHLACAAEAEREGDESGNEDTAWRRALERFGDPNAMARRLWWDAMRETVMREWIHTGALALLALVGVAGVVFMGLMLWQFGATNEAVLTALANQGRGEARWATLEVDIRRGNENGPPAVGVTVMCTGKMFGEESANMTQTVADSNTLTFGPMLPGSYQLYCKDPQSGLQTSRTVTLFAGAEPLRTRMVAPDVEPRATSFAFDRPVSPGSEEQLLALQLFSRWEYGEHAWWGSQDCFIGPDSARSIHDGFLEQNSPRIFQYGGDVPVQSEYIADAKYPVLLAGHPEVGNQAILMKKLDNEWFFSESVLLAFQEEATDGGDVVLRTTLPAPLVTKLDDWAMYDELLATSIAVSHDLVTAIRQKYPNASVARAIPVPWSTAVSIVDGRYARREAQVDYVYEFLPIVNGERFIDAGNGTERTVGVNVLFQFPEFPEPIGPGQRLVLGWFAEIGNVGEFNNPLEAWAVYSDIDPAQWPPLVYHSVLDETLGVLEIGEGVLQSMDYAELTSGPQWKFTEVSAEVVGERDAPKALLLKWKNDEKEYTSRLELVSAEAKEIKNENRRPVWLVLEPLASPDETASNGQPLKDIDGRFHYDAEVPVEVGRIPAAQ